MDNNPPVPSSSKIAQRPSIFDDDADLKKYLKSHKENASIRYPTNYVEKVKTEIESWKTEISKTLEEKKEYKNKILELENTIVHEKMLSSEQHDVIASFGFDEYIRRIKDFCDQSVIIANIHQNETKDRYEVSQHIPTDLLKRYNNTS